MPFKLPDEININYRDLNNFAKYFNPFVSVIKKKKYDIQVEEGTSRSIESYVYEPEQNIELRYKKINKYGEMNAIYKFIYDIVKNNKDIKDKIIDNISITFGISNVLSKQIYTNFMKI